MVLWDFLQMVDWNFLAFVCTGGVSVVVGVLLFCLSVSSVSGSLLYLNCV
jgi:hypothetical protein